MRIAIVGFGPKGLHALERLLDHAHALSAGHSLVVDLYEPDPNPGSGPNYAPEQPDYLRMNFAADLIDMWWPEGHAVPPGEQRSFVRWRAATGAVEAYPPRNQVGRYLSDCFEALLRNAPRAATVRLRATSVDAVLPDGGAWDVCVSGAVAGTYDEVLIATGHASGSPTALAAGWCHAASLVARVFPVERWLDRDQIAPGRVVAIRGFGLTSIDAALALSEGRGGSFRRAGRSFELVYEPAPGQVGLIVPYARSGRPMLAKPGPEVTLGLHELTAITSCARQQLMALERPVDLYHELLPILAQTAADSLLAAAGVRCNPDEWFANAAAGVPNEPALSATEAIRRSLEVGAGLVPPDLAWAVGHAWRALYPAIVQNVGDGGLSEADWPSFHRLAAELERVAFGPSPVNAAKLLALVEAGIADLSLVGGAALADRDGRTFLVGASGEQAVDVVVDAVLPGPGALPGQDALLDRLIADGHARVAAARRGLDVELDGSCRARGGGLSHGLAAIGRPTEDAVIGNDTLSRTLHPLADRWARRVVERAQATA